MLKGCVNLWCATGQEEYRRFVLNYLAGEVSQNGGILHYETKQYNIDSVNSGKALAYVPNLCGGAAHLGTLEECVAEATR